MSPKSLRLVRAVAAAIMLTAAALSLAALSAAAHAASPPAPPNIVLILADDLGINDLVCYGRTDHRTPHLDRLAAAGARFTAAYAPAPLCSASRAALLTGKHPARLHLTSFLPGRPDTPAQRLRQPVQEGQLPLEEITLAEALQPAGYSTACLGKWHLGGPGFEPAAQGFQVAAAGQPDSTPSATEGSKGEMGLAARAETFIATHRDRPFFLFLAHDSPHIPFAATEESRARHAGAFNPTYAAVIESLDASVGRVLDALESHGLTERTIVVFTSDNGGLHVPELGLDPPTHNTPHRGGKGSLHDGGLRVPLIVRWPGTTRAGSVRAEPVVLTDLMPTLMQAAGLDPSRASGPLDGVSLLPLLRPDDTTSADTKAGPVDADRPLFWHFPHYSNQGGHPSGALREGRWKLIEDYESGTTRLYDVVDEPAEATDRSGDHPDIATTMKTRLDAWRDQVGAQRNHPNPEFSAAVATAIDQTDVSRPPAPTTAAALGQAWAAWRTAMDAATAGHQPRVTPARGDIRLHARDARTHGSKLRYEPEPWKNTLGYWVEAGDWAEWDVTVPAAGRYEIEILQGCGAGQGGSEVDLAIAGESIRFTVRETGHFQNFIAITLGEVALPAGPATLTLRPHRKAHAAVMDVRRIVLRPLP